MMRRFIVALTALALSSAVAYAQGVPLQGGAWTPGHSPMYLGNGSTQPVMQDSGPAAGGGPGLGLAEQLLVARGIGLAQPPYQNAGSGPSGANWCDYDGPTTGPYHYFCISPNTNGQPSIVIGAGGGATPQSLNLLINGQTYAFPFNTAINGSVVGGDLAGVLPNPTVKALGGLPIAAVATSGSASDLKAGTLPSAQMPAFGAPGDISCPAGNPSACLVNTIGGKAVAAIATSPVAQNLMYQAPFTGSVAEALNAYLSRVVWVDSAGATGSGVADDEPAIQVAAASLGTTGGTVRLSCGKRYFINENLPLGVAPGTTAILPNVTLEGCNHNPDDPAVIAGMPGEIQTLGGIIRAPGASIIVGRNGRVEHLSIVQQGITTGMDSAASFAGTAITQAGPFPAGQTISIEDVNILGGNICYDGTAGGSRIKMKDVIGDCNTGFIFGTSADSSEIGYVHPYPSATATFPGYAGSLISGNGTTTTVSYTGASITLPVSDYVQIQGVSGFPTAPTPGFKVTASAPGQIQFASSFNGTATGTLLDYSQVNLRPGTGIIVEGQNDDTRFDNVFDFGHNIGIDFQCNGHGIWHMGRFWGDNNLTYGLHAQNCPFVHANSVHIASIGGQGAHITSSDFSIDDFKDTSAPSVCFLAELGGHVQVGNMDISNCSQFGVFPGSGSTIHIHSLVTTSTPIPVGAPSPAESLKIDSIWTDLPAGSTIIGGGQRIASTIQVSGVTMLPQTTNVSLNGQCETYYVASTAAVSILGGAWGGRCLRLIEESTGTLVTGGDIALVGNNTFGGNAGNEIEVEWDNVVNNGNAYGGNWREHWRR